MTIDNLVMSFMKSIESPFLTSISKFISMITEPTILFIVSVFLGIYLYFKKSKKDGSFFVWVMTISSILVVLLKTIFQRARPLDSLIVETGFSFPSGHAMLSIIFFGLLVYLFLGKKLRKTKIISATLAVLIIGFTRLYLRVHWFSDVIGGYLIGGIILFLAIFFYKKYE